VNTNAPRICWGCGESDWHNTGGHYEDGSAIYECRGCGELSAAIDEKDAVGNAILFVTTGLIIADILTHSSGIKEVLEATNG